jgi:hypothetical protein
MERRLAKLRSASFFSAERRYIPLTGGRSAKEPWLCDPLPKKKGIYFHVQSQLFKFLGPMKWDQLEKKRFLFSACQVNFLIILVSVE